MTFRNRLMLATRAAGGRPTRARSKWSRANCVLLLQIEGQGQFQAYAHQFRPGGSGWTGRPRWPRPGARAESPPRLRTFGTPGWRPNPGETARRSGPDGPATRGRRISRASANRFTFDQRPRGIDARVGRQVRSPWLGWSPNIRRRTRRCRGRRFRRSSGRWIISHSAVPTRFWRSL